MKTDLVYPLTDDAGAPATDPAFFVNGYGHHHVATISNEKREIRIFCDGAMRLHLWPNKKARDEGADHEVIRDTGSLFEVGITNDKQLSALDEDSSEWVNNAWFDLYAYGEGIDGEHLDAVFHDLNEAIEHARLYLVDEEMWSSLSSQ